jgi:biotin carboxylase
MKAIIIIGGSYLQLRQIEWARELGLYVVVTDRNPDAKGRKLADRFEVLNGDDIEGLLELADRFDREYGLAGVYASSDFGLPAYAAVTESLNLPGCSRLAVKQALDKSLSRSILQRENIPVPAGERITSSQELLSAVEVYGLPVILKPICSSGSQGITSVHEHKNLEAAFLAARNFSPEVLVEQIVPGPHIDVNGVLVEGKFLACGTMDRHFSELPYHYPVWGCQPSLLSIAQENAVYEIVEQASRAIGITSGPVKADVVWTDKGAVILELAPRFHGDVSTSFVTPLATGTWPVKAWMAYMKGDKNFMEFLKKDKIQFAGWTALFPTSFGKLVRVVNAEAARDVKGVQNIFIAKEAGSIIKQARDNTALCGFIWATAPSRDELLKTLNQARSMIQFVTQ